MMIFIYTYIEFISIRHLQVIHIISLNDKNNY